MCDNNMPSTTETQYIQQVIKAQAHVRGYLARRDYVKLGKKKAHRASVVKEIVSTEQSYVKSLETMIDVYLVPLRDDPKKFGISKEEVQIMFANIETIVNLHKEMVKVLEERVNSWNNTKKIGDIFINFAPFLKMLNGYCSNYDAAITTLTQVRQDRKTFSLFLEKCETTLQVQILPAYLIQPIQRVPRYNLLLEDLIRSTWEWHNDYEALCNALRAMKQIADHINESLHKSEKANKVVKIQSDLGGECVLVEPHRRWIKDGPVIRVKRQGQTSSPVSTNKLWIYLFNDIIVFAGRILLSYRFIEKYPLDSTSVQDIAGSDKFQIASVAAQSAYILALETVEQKNTWLQAITQAIQSYSDTIPDIKFEQRKTIERESSLNLAPVNRDSTLISPNSPPSHSHSSTPIPQPLTQQATSSTCASHAALSQASRAAQSRPVTPSTLMKFDFNSMLVTEGGEEEEEMTFQERRLMFERGLLPQVQVAAPPPRRPVAKLAKSNPKNLSSKQHPTDKHKGSSLPLTNSGKNVKVSQNSAKSNATPNKLNLEIPRGIVGELKQKYDAADENGYTSPRGNKKSNDESHSPLLGKTSPSPSSPKSNPGKKDSSCCVIL
eukprot:Phypoly_transcript_00684.p1 GENE.Phypoly_transcript_00684~~Phypoly_transcript_00684.p1  ORF type:complete len:608 (+),score=96.31 Phypoly_transcript_00684:2275-4098(+)